jgi:hypothetical protein
MPLARAMLHPSHHYLKRIPLAMTAVCMKLQKDSIRKLLSFSLRMAMMSIFLQPNMAVVLHCVSFALTAKHLKILWGYKRR